MSPGLRVEFDEPESDEVEDDDLLDEQEVAASQERQAMGAICPASWLARPSCTCC